MKEGRERERGRERRGTASSAEEMITPFPASEKDVGGDAAFASLHPFSPRLVVPTIHADGITVSLSVSLINCSCARYSVAVCEHIAFVAETLRL